MSIVSKSINTLLEMFQHRGSPFVDDMKKIAIPEANAQSGNFNIVAGQLCLVYNLGNVKYSVESVKSEIFKLCDKYPDSKHFVVIMQQIVPNEKLLAVREYFANNKCTFEMFAIYELSCNISKHFMVPKHELISSEKDITKIIESEGVKSRHHFPHILITDPMARFIGAKLGNLVKVTRDSPSAGEHIIYRCVV